MIWLLYKFNYKLCLYRVMDALGKFGEHLRSQSCSRLSPRATLTLLLCSPNFPRASITRYTHAKHEPILKYTTKVNGTFRARSLARLEVISQVLFTSEQPKKNKMAFVGILSQIKLHFWPLVIQLVWYILKQLFTSVSVKVIDIYLHFGEYLLTIVLRQSSRVAIFMSRNAKAWKCKRALLQ